jgi:cytochrome c-type biogenesis protein CcmE
MKLKIVIGIIAIIGFTTLLMVNFGHSISSYTNFVQAKNRKHARVVGTWAKAEPSGFSIKKKRFMFYMKDEDGNVRKVIYPKPEPSNFVDAKRLVVTGRLQGGIFYANDMLMKCPSKYNATPQEVKAHSSKKPEASL